ncbi:nucleoside triphosphate pyrophosphatase [Kocuria sp.]|uniref:Maf family protein n=1 Tax=Kocuria sp. TaxID=1871328 RepID=UPI0026DD572B|nr:nucleoside triphosphate pyrophosphatase [Kocuria sp.]MDO4919658.1 nucleoside triphosphate pyrophosphatase [Kocuria sp.]
MEPPLILASRSPARAGLLRSAGIPFDTVVSHVDEDALVAAQGPLSPRDTALVLARAKAEAVAQLPGSAGRLVVGCDSVFELDGEALGKPHDPAVAVERLTAMSGRTGTLHTGHWLVDARREPATGQGVLRSADVHFAPMTATEIRDYVATGEPLEVAGSFTLDGHGAVFVRGVTGEPSTVIGLSLSALRELLGAAGVGLTSWWEATAHGGPEDL